MLGLKLEDLAMRKAGGLPMRVKKFATNRCVKWKKPCGNTLRQIVTVILCNIFFTKPMSNDNELITNSILKTICCKKLLIFPFHGITSSYSYFEVIWIFVPIQQEAKHDQEKLSAELKSLLTKPSNVLPFYTSNQNSNFL